jgi:hypothetical protein
MFSNILLYTSKMAPSTYPSPPLSPSKIKIFEAQLIVAKTKAVAKKAAKKSKGKNRASATEVKGDESDKENEMEINRKKGMKKTKNEGTVQ